MKRFIRLREIKINKDQERSFPVHHAASRVFDDQHRVMYL